MAKTKEQLLNILDQFQLDEKVVSAEPFGNGHINDTLKVTNEKGEIKYVLQRINHLIFTNVDMLQNNIHVVTTHIRKKLEEKGETDIDRKVLTFLPTKDGKKYYFDGDSYWRVCLFIPRSKSYEEVTPELSYEAKRSVISRPCCPIYPRVRWARPFRISIIWSSACDNSMRL